MQSVIDPNWPEGELVTLYSRLCTLTLYARTLLSSCTVLPPVDCVPLHSLYSHIVLSSCTLLPPLDSVPLHSLYSVHSLCTLDSAFSHSLRSRPFTLESVLSTLHSRSLHSDSAFSHSLYSRLCILVVCTLTLHSHTLCTLDSTFSWSALCLCTLTLCSHRTLLSLLSSLCPRTLGTLDSALSPLCSRTVQTLSALTISALSTLDSRTLCTLDSVLSDCTLDHRHRHRHRHRHIE